MKFEDWWIENVIKGPNPLGKKILPAVAARLAWDAALGENSQDASYNRADRDPAGEGYPFSFGYSDPRIEPAAAALPVPAEPCPDCDGRGRMPWGTTCATCDGSGKNAG